MDSFQMTRSVARFLCNRWACFTHLSSTHQYI